MTGFSSHWSRNLLAGGPPPSPRYPGGLRPPDTLHSGGSQTPVKCQRDYGRWLTTKPAHGSCDSGRPKQWPVTSLLPGGCDSSRPGLGVPVWPAEAATARSPQGKNKKYFRAELRCRVWRFPLSSIFKNIELSQATSASNFPSPSK